MIKRNHRQERTFMLISAMEMSGFRLDYSYEQGIHVLELDEG